MSTEQINYSVYEDFDTPVQNGVGVRLPRLQLFNPHNLRRGTKLHNGGYAVESDFAMVGDHEEITLGSGDKIRMSTGPEVNCAIIGWSPLFYVFESPDPVDPSKTIREAMGAYREPNKTAGEKCSSAIALFVVIDNDPAQELRQLTLKGFQTNHAVKAIQTTLNLTANAAKVMGVRNVHPFALWIKLGTTAPQLVGKAPNQSEVCGPVVLTKPDANLLSNLVAPDDYAKFREYRQQLDMLMGGGDYGPPEVAQALLAGRNGHSAPQLAAPGASGAVIDHE